MLVNETIGKPGSGEPFMWSPLCDIVADELARLDCLDVSVTADIVSGTAQYNNPTQIYKIVAVAVEDQSDYLRLVEAVVPAVMDKRNHWWRTNQSVGVPEYAIMQGLNTFVLYPTPDYSVTAGMTIEGFGVPSTAGTNGTNLWPLDTDECPLKEHVQAAIPFGMAYYRCIQYPTPENMIRLPHLKERYEFMTEELMREIQDSSAGTQFGDAPDTSLRFFGMGYGF